jgi:SAM-dependent methyltransferase
LRESFPQIPAEAKKLESVVERLLGVVLEAMQAPSGSMAKLSLGLQQLQIKGLGQANQLWPRLFVMSGTGMSAPGRLDLTQAPRAELAEFLRALLADCFSQKPERLEWAIASALAWRPASLPDLHRLLVRTEPEFLDFDAFERAYGTRLAFDSAAASAAQSPDWAVLWEYQGITGYGGAYPADVRNALVSFLTTVKGLEPAAAILDIGTGNHAATLLAREIGRDFELYGIDVARLPAPPAQARIHNLTMSADRLGFTDERFSAAMSVNGIEYADVDRAFPEMRRVLRPGAPALLVLHRPDSLIVASARAFLEFVEQVPLMETLGLAWLFVHEGSERARRELTRQAAKLEAIEVQADFGRYYRTVLKGIPEAIRLRSGSPERARELIERFQKDLDWRYRRDRFIVSHMSRIPASRNELEDWLRRERFAVDQVAEVFDDTHRDGPPLGWAVRIHKPQA